MSDEYAPDPAVWGAAIERALAVPAMPPTYRAPAYTQERHDYSPRERSEDEWAQIMQGGYYPLAVGVLLVRLDWRPRQ